MVVYINVKVYIFSLTTIMSTTKRQISVKNKEYTNNKFKYQREERIQISSAKVVVFMPGWHMWLQC